MPVWVDWILGVLVEWQEGGFVILKPCGHEGFFIADGEVNKASHELE